MNIQGNIKITTEALEYGAIDVLSYSKNNLVKHINRDPRILEAIHENIVESDREEGFKNLDISMYILGENEYQTLMSLIKGLPDVKIDYIKDMIINHKPNPVQP